MQKPDLSSSSDSVPSCQQETPENDAVIPCRGCRSASGISHSVKRGLCFKLHEASKSIQAAPVSNALSDQCGSQQLRGIDISPFPSTGSFHFTTGVFERDCKSCFLEGNQDLSRLPPVSGQHIHAKEVAMPRVIGAAQCSTSQDALVNLDSATTADSTNEGTIRTLKRTISKLQMRLDDLLSQPASRHDTEHCYLNALCASLTSRANSEDNEVLRGKSGANSSAPLLVPQAKDEEFIRLTGLDAVVDSLLQMSS